MTSFQKRFYRRPAELWRDVATLWRMRNVLRRGIGGGAISRAFQERLMLAVTGVNGCRYCSYVHTRQALRAGVDRGEMAGYLSGDLNGAPEGEVPALLYAQHWAETGGNPEAEARLSIREKYGEQQAEAIESALAIIQVANLLGNTFDYLLFKLGIGARLHIMW